MSTDIDQHGDAVAPEQPAPQPAAPVTPKGEAEPHFRHPGLGWLDQAACDDLEQQQFFVEAGHVMPEKARAACMGCPVWETCLTFSYLGNPDGKMISGGYFAALSLGQRKKMTLGEALEYGRRVRTEAGYQPAAS